MLLYGALKYILTGQPGSGPDRIRTQQVVQVTRSAFFKRLHKEGVLQLVVPSDEMKTAYLKKSESHLVSARLLLDNDLFEQSVSMAYYSMYYSVMSLFLATGIKCENHTAAIILLSGNLCHRQF
jgi:hypothetical protein